MHFIFDLDDTVVNTSHRQRLLADGSIDLEFWRANCTVGMVARDKLLPLASKMQGAIRDGLDVIVCTSRVMGAADFAFLRAHKMLGNVTLSRMGGDERGCGILKLDKLQGLAMSRGIQWQQFAADSIMFDDSKEVQTVLGNAGVRVIDPVQYNLSQQKVA